MLCKCKINGIVLWGACYLTWSVKSAIEALGGEYDHFDRLAKNKMIRIYFSWNPRCGLICLNYAVILRY